VGALVEPLTSQMAEYLGVPGGLMVRQVARKSEASSAGLKAFDVSLKVGPEAIATMADWERALHANQGKPVQVTVLRDRKQQTLTLQVDSKRHGELEFEEIFPAGDEPVMAGIEPGFVQQFAREAAPPALRDQLQAGGMEHFALSPEQVEALRKQADELRDSMKGENFKIDPKQLDQLKQQMDEFRKNFKPDNFKLDPKQMDELRQQMEQLKRQMEEIKGLSLDGRV
jgi:membrane-associated protease RseP (regulator of RpoE activity)